MDKIMECVPCCTVDDEERFRKIINEAIKSKKVKKYKKFTSSDTKENRAKRRAAAADEAQEAEEHAKVIYAHSFFVIFKFLSNC